MLKRPEVTVNVDNILKLADLIEGVETVKGYKTKDIYLFAGNPEKFSMGVVVAETDCGMVGCISGWCRAIRGEETSREFLGITPEQGDALFMPVGWMQDRYTAKDAAKVLRHLALTGEVDWSVVE